MRGLMRALALALVLCPGVAIGDEQGGSERLPETTRSEDFGSTPTTTPTPTTTTATAPTAPPSSTPNHGWFSGFFAASSAARKARCATALCWGKDNKYGLEPFADLPVGKVFSFSDGDLATFENSHDFSATISAGLRLWLAYDFVSLGITLSKPLYSGTSKIRLEGSSFEYDTSNIRRPYPGLVLGLFMDVLWIGLDYDELHNGDSDTNRDLNYPRNYEVSDALVFTVALAPLTLARTLLGLSTGQAATAGEATTSPTTTTPAQHGGTNPESPTAEGKKDQGSKP